MTANGQLSSAYRSPMALASTGSNPAKRQTSGGATAQLKGERLLCVATYFPGDLKRSSGTVRDVGETSRSTKGSAPLFSYQEASSCSE
ncbi:hypothetical protein MRX96_012469 [Rhipicephalus microplus]